MRVIRDAHVESRSKTSYHDNQPNTHRKMLSLDLASRRITIDRIKLAHEKIDPVFTNTPYFNCDPLSTAIFGPDLKTSLALKIETLNPIRSFKGRGASWLAQSLTPGQDLICASAGNFGQAVAYACSSVGVSPTIYASVNANPLKITRMKELGANVVLSGEDFDAAKMEAKRVAKESGIPFIEDGDVPEPTEGAGTIGLEVALSYPRLPIDYLLVPLGNGAMLAGVATALKSLVPEVQIVAVQASGAPAMIESLQSGQLVRKDTISTIADGIGVREPVPIALEDLKGLVDDFVLVGEDELVKAMKLLHLHAGFVAEPSGAAGVAALLNQADKFRGKRVGTIICGANLTEAQIKDWLA